MKITPDMIEVAVTLAEQAAGLVFRLVDAAEEHTAEERAATIASIKVRLAAANAKVAAVVIRDIPEPPFAEPGAGIPDSGKGYVDAATAGARAESDVVTRENRYFLDGVEVSPAEYTRRTDPRTPLDK